MIHYMGHIFGHVSTNKKLKMPFFILFFIKDVTQQLGHNIDFDQATIVDKALDYHKRLFLEALHSKQDRNAGN